MPAARVPLLEVMAAPVADERLPPGAAEAEPEPPPAANLVPSTEVPAPAAWLVAPAAPAWAADWVRAEASRAWAEVGAGAALAVVDTGLDEVAAPVGVVAAVSTLPWAAPAVVPEEPVCALPVMLPAWATPPASDPAELLVGDAAAVPDPVPDPDEP